MYRGRGRKRGGKMNGGEYERSVKKKRKDRVRKEI